MPRRSHTRERVLDVSAQIFRRQGYAGTGLKQIVAEGQAPFGSIYHFFPGGKEQLGDEALRRAGAGYESLIARVFERSKDPPSAVMRWFEMAAEALERSDFADGCPIATVALDVASTNDVLRSTCAEVFESWQQHVVDEFVDAGMRPRDARSLASAALASLEGAIVLSRTARDTGPLGVSGKLMRDATRAALARSRERRGRT